jgi:hypothetical protein
MPKRARDILAANHSKKMVSLQQKLEKAKAAHAQEWEKVQAYFKTDGWCVIEEVKDIGKPDPIIKRNLAYSVFEVNEKALHRAVVEYVMAKQFYQTYSGVPELAEPKLHAHLQLDILRFLMQQRGMLIDNKPKN